MHEKLEVLMAGAMVMQLRQGRQYSKDWPMIDEFNAIFRENLVIRMTQFAERLLPMAFAVIVGLYVWQGEAAQMHLLLVARKTQFKFLTARDSL